MVDFAKAYSVGDFYALDILLNIPTYQRKFVWGPDQITARTNALAASAPGVAEWKVW